MKKPFPAVTLTTHLANIALNPLLGLIFILAEAQKTCGLSNISKESLTSDQLSVARWMILSFLFKFPEQDHEMAEPWQEIPPYRIKLSEFPDKEDLARYTETLEQISSEFQVYGESLWDEANTDVRRALLTRLVAQIEEVEAFLRRRIELGLLCSTLPSGPDFILPEFEKAILSLGPDTARELYTAFGDLGASSMIAPMGYINITHARPATGVFAQRLLSLVRQIVCPEAVRRGYAQPPVAK